MPVIKQLRENVREFSLPAELVLADGETLLCVEMLRLVPGKRAVMKARWREKSALVKLMLSTASGRRNVRHELAGCEILNDAEIRTPKLLLNARCADGSHVLAFEFLPRAQTLGELWRANRNDGAGCGLNRPAIAAYSLDLMAKLHRNGCSHADPHLDNFLTAGGEIYTVDAASIKREPKRKHGAWRRKNWALFLAQFTPAWQQKMLSLLTVNDATAGHDAKLPQAVERAWRRRKSRYLKKCFRECSEFSLRRSWRQVAAWKRAEECDDLFSFVKNPDAWVEKGELLKDGSSTTVVRVTMGERQVTIRRNNIKNIRHWLSRCLRTTRGHINWRNAHLLQISGIATPDPVAFVEKRWGVFRGRSYYVCAFDNSPSADKKYHSQPPDDHELARFADLFSNMRRARLYHGDFKSSNLLVRDEDIALIDLDSVAEFRPAWAEVYLQKDRQRFLENWKDKPQQQKRFAEIFNEK